MSSILLIFLGLLMGTWVFYNLFIHLEPVAKSTPPGPAIFLSLGCILLGLHKLTNGKIFKYSFWGNREVQKWISTFLGGLVLAYAVNMVIRYRHYTSISFEILLTIAFDLFCLFVLGKFFFAFLMNFLHTDKY